VRTQTNNKKIYVLLLKNTQKVEKRIRIKDIAEKAGVSTGTVDRVLHNRGSVSSKAREKVLKVLDELNYKRNIIASTLAYNRIFKIAAIIPACEKDPFWQQPKAGIQLALESVHHYSIDVIFYHFETEIEDFKAVAQKALEDQPDAILLAPEFSKEGNEFLETCKTLKIPYVLINTNIIREDKNLLTYIGQDSYQSGVLAGRLLRSVIEKKQEVIIINLEKKAHNASHLINKEEGFRQYFADEHYDSNSILKFDFENFEDQKALHSFLKTQLEAHPNVGGIFVTNSRAYRVADFLEEQQIDHIRLVGFDLIQENLEYLKKGYISYLINQNPFKQGYLGILNLFNHLILKKKVEQVQYLPLDIVIPENVEYYRKEEISLQVVV
jgi:LacI family transcriptional regulator